MKTYLKTLVRAFEKHVTRFISIILMVFVSVGFISGIGTSADKLKYSLTDYYTAHNVNDVIVKSTSDDGFTPSDMSRLTQIYGENNVNFGMSLDVNVKFGEESRLTRLYFLDFSHWTVNIPEITDGSEVDFEEKTKIYAECADNKIAYVKVGEKVELDFNDILKQLNESEDDVLPVSIVKELEVSAIVQSPLTFAKDGEPSYKNTVKEVPDTINAVNKLIILESILYIPIDIIPKMDEVYRASLGDRYEFAAPMLPDKDKSLLPTGDAYISSPDRTKFESFGRNYQGHVDSMKNTLSSELGGDIEFITLYDNYSFYSLDSYRVKVLGIGIVLMVAFIFVTALVVLSTMTRLLEEERAQIACLRTLGYSSFKILFKYLLFAAIATGIGGVGAYFIGLGLAYMIYLAFGFSFVMPPISSSVALLFYLITYAIIVTATLFATFLAGRKLTSERPAELMRPKPPRAGKKVILEKIPFIWNKLSFKYKSTMRNVLRYKSRFIMTVVSVAISMSLVFAGLALLDLCLFGDIGSPTITAIAVVVIIFAGLLTVAVIYTLTNINVSERNRELATLMVLGYHGKEVAGYIYREIYIDTFVGIIFGYPASALIVWLVFTVLDMGALGAVSWYWWLVAPVIVFLFTGLVTLMLTKKIVGIDMNESLKAVE